LAAVLSWRTLVLAGVLGLAFALVWPSIRVYNEQRASNSALVAQRDAAKAQVDDLNAQLARWKDPAFVVAQARERLAYVYPGETPYRVVDPQVARPAAAGSVDAAAKGDVTVGEPWFDRMWSSVKSAGAEPETKAPAPGPVSPVSPTNQQAPLPNVELGG
jgi:cell division protein FtsB